MLAAERIYIVGLGSGESTDINMRDAGEFPLGFTRRPTGHLDTGEVVACGELQHLWQ
jgi:hypothetical protein